MNDMQDKLSARHERSAFKGLVVAIMTLLPLAMGARGCDYAVVGNDCASDGGANKAGCPGSCTSNGKRYATGDSFMSSDGCNLCTCQADGQALCTLRACAGSSTCGGLAGRSCAKDEYCAFSAAASCGAADATGTCKMRPQACTAIYKPVCGCDDTTYGNECEAAAAGVSAASSGECAAGGGGGCDYSGKHYASGGTFPSADGCNQCSCQSDGSVACTEIGCSGGPTCGGLAGGVCAKSQYCNFPPDAKCGAADATGMCAPLPTACTKEYKPVCGCDGTTYGNACSAAAAGVSVAMDGACGSGGSGGCDYNGKHYGLGDSFPDTLGCNTCKCGATPGSVECTMLDCGSGKSCNTASAMPGPLCPTGEYCDVGPKCALAGVTGICTMMPQVCDTLYAPVCGCDGKTYANACNAASAGVSVAQSGECPSAGGCNYNGQQRAAGESFPSVDGCNTCSCQKDGSVICTERACVPNTCGGIAALTCPKDQYCDFPVATNCGATDQSGTCAPKPQACTAIYKPVCGCDGNTYSSDCVAASAGVSVKAQGACM